ncbi:MAG: hypothetical protein C0518_05470 [Opitutus sp.]|nr:hypothetical protein [Opitutus sp.]
MATAHQLSLTFACIDFPDRTTVSVTEIAAKLGYSLQHVLDHIDEGKLVALDSALVQSRRNLRVTVDEYRRWVLSMLTGPQRRTFLAELTPAQLREIQREATELLRSVAA